MILVLGLHNIDKVLCLLLFIAGFKALSNCLGQSRLLVFDGKDVVDFLFEDLRGNLCWAACRVEGHQEGPSTEGAEGGGESP